MRNFQNAELLSVHVCQNTKGGYLFSCEEKKRNMEIVCRTDAGAKINTFKIPMAEAALFMATFNGQRNFKLSQVIV